MFCCLCCRWLESHTNCPICRKDLDAGDQPSSSRDAGRQPGQQQQPGQQPGCSEAPSCRTTPEPRPEDLLRRQVRCVAAAPRRWSVFVRECVQSAVKKGGRRSGVGAARCSWCYLSCIQHAPIMHTKRGSERAQVWEWCSLANSGS